MINLFPDITQEDYEIRLVQRLLAIRFLRPSNGKFVTSRTIAEETIGFETEDSLCREWLLSIYNSYSFYEGFDSIEDCIEFIEGSYYDNHLYRIVQFSSMFYAVINENSQYQQVVGKEISYFTRNNLLLCTKRPPANLTFKERIKMPPIPLIYYELHAFDPQIKIFKANSSSSIEFNEVPILDEIEYAVLLGVTFKDIWYTCDTPQAIAHNRALLNLYFNRGHNLTLFGKYSKALAINPFQRLVYLPKGRIEQFQMDADDTRAQQRLLPYRDVRRFHENIRTRPVKIEEASVTE
jgi:hypothetical protein